MSDVITLVDMTYTQDSDGYETAVEKKTEVYAEVESVSRSEFYAAYKAGLQLALAFTTRYENYNGEKYVDFNGKRYQVERTYAPNRDYIQLNCSEVVQ